MLRSYRDLVFLWSRLYLRAHPSKQGFLSECRQLMLSAINASAIFPFIKVITAEVGVQPNTNKSDTLVCLVYPDLEINFVVLLFT